MNVKILNIKVGKSTELEFSDLDRDDEMEINVDDRSRDIDLFIYLNIDDMINLKNHLSYLQILIC